ncbi:MAG: S-adenosylmethionine:tRNA ribosyltransferase-isomerase [Bacteroidota bacterium]
MGLPWQENPGAAFAVEKLQPYRFKEPLPTTVEALKAILSYMNDRGTDEITGHTSIFIIPGYEFKICQGLITNFHQPGSTLLLLIAAFLGADWKKVYAQALDNGYRFLSYW